MCLLLLSMHAWGTPGWYGTAGRQAAATGGQVAGMQDCNGSEQHERRSDWVATNSWLTTDRMWGFPAAAIRVLSAVISSLLTCSRRAAGPASQKHACHNRGCCYGIQQRAGAGGGGGSACTLRWQHPPGCLRTAACGSRCPRWPPRTCSKRQQSSREVHGDDKCSTGGCGSGGSGGRWVC